MRDRAIDDRLLATRLTARNVNSATQFCGSAIVNVRTGGRKKKLKLTIAATEVVDRDPQRRGGGDNEDDQEKAERDRGAVAHLQPLDVRQREQADGQRG